MIAFLEGTVAFIEAHYAVIMVQGVGYQVTLTKPDLDHLTVAEMATFHIHTHVREDALELFGFKQRDKKMLFQLLLSVSGVGPKLALQILSTLSAHELISAIVEKNLAVLSSISGIGKKTAERLVLELKEKAAKFELPFSPHNATAQGLQQALKSLGYGKDHYDKIVAQLDPHDLQNLPLEALIKKSLMTLTTGKMS